MNQAQKVLMMIGGTASLVAGHMNHYWADGSTPKKTRTRGRVGGGKYGVALLASFATKNATPERLAKHKAHLIHMAERKKQ